MLFKYFIVRGDVRFVDYSGSVGGGVEESNKETDLEEVVEGNVVENESCELIDNVESSEDNPVGQPLFLSISVVSLILKGEETFEGGVGHSHEAGNV
jgi:hypothetical protein